ncbi:virulence RhuM family protein [Methanobrevibacter curvatus]|uniref:Bro-N domain-containing protein n=1 Tax=Methanobrevibacter curvatus TaxID=49547 RepID=A0A166DZJ5_9EURY|nr:virulence RhuM family protein [Methanobrevibacter curvatus]KZX16118.1 hypothetical protein MBCUR_01120 [Methanobrevibacter curvatus]
MEEKDIKLTETLLYTGPDGAVTLEVIIDQKNQTMWASQKTMAELFQKDRNTISEHIQNIFKTGELDENSVTRKFRLTASDGKKYNTQVYNLDAMISVGYRVNSKQGTQFRIWATNILKDYMIKGFVLDDELLKNGTRFGKDYFDELLERIRKIRTSERRFNQKITDIYATSYDYNLNAELTKDFFANVQNKLIFAVSGNTAAEIIASRADSEKPYMGLTNWKNPQGQILMSDIVISKNYLNETELDNLNRIVEGFLLLAELRAKNQIPTSMKQWKNVLDDYIKLNQLLLLENKGKITSKMAIDIAKKHYEKFIVFHDKEFQSDFDKMIDEIKRIEGKNL